MWDDEWVLVALRDPESGVRVLMDGNEHARQLQIAVAEGAVEPDRRVRLVTGDRNLGVVRVSKAVSPLWR